MATSGTAVWPFRWMLSGQILWAHSPSLVTTSSVFLMRALHTPDLMRVCGGTDGGFPWPYLCRCCWQSGSQCPNSHCALTHHPLWPNPTWRRTLHSSRLQPHLLQQGPNPSFGEGHSSKFVCSLDSITQPSSITFSSLYMFIYVTLYFSDFSFFHLMTHTN